MKQQKTLIKIALLVLMLGLSAGSSYQQEMEAKPPADSPQSVTPLLIGADIPKATLKTIDGNSFDLNAAIAEKPTILMFYRGGWCGYCDTQLGQLKAIEDQVLQLGYQIIAISPDSQEKMKESIEKHEMKYLLLSDTNMETSKAFGIAYKVDQNTAISYSLSNIKLTYDSMAKSYLLPVPSVFVVGTEGFIKFEYVNPDHRVRLEPDVLLAVIKK